MYFQPQVKEKKEDFFNFEVLQQELQRALDDKLIPLIAVHGLRRTGKTSLIRVVLNSSAKKYIWIDSRDITSRHDFYEHLAEQTQKYQRFKVERVSIHGIGFALPEKKQWDYLNQKKIILVIDEAHLLKRIKLDNLLAYIYDNYPQIKMVLSGSETGMLMNFLGKNSAQAPLYGRAVFELQTQRLDKENARRFLIEGGRQAEKTLPDDEIREVIEKLDGIIGWLTKYGWYRLRLRHAEALRKAIVEGKLVVKEEFLRFSLHSEKRYQAILRAMKGGASWDEIKPKVTFSEKQLYQMLVRLIHHGFVDKRDRIYTVADPLLEAAF